MSGLIDLLVGIRLWFVVIITTLVISTVLFRILWKKPGYYKKILAEITSTEPVQTNIGRKIFNLVFTVFFVCCFLVFIGSWIGLIILILLAVGF